ncbi:unnamed protein product [Caenorhabditis auriculariae]|uniref:RNA helicase n=1 Tax=Caenorhabditis auriculariae TaxID=2777116 RepID=A0A8S1GXN1_9PELO|nr:unnamed protein product [Caenorhabditis auriculariae]
MDDGDSYRTCDQPNDLIIAKGKGRSEASEAKKGETKAGGKRKRNFAQEKQQAKLTKKARRQLAAVQARKALKQTQEDLFKGLAEYQLDSSKLSQLSSSSHVADKEKEAVFAHKMKVFKGKNAEERLKGPKVDDHYYPTDDEEATTSGSEADVDTDEKDVIERIEVENAEVEVVEEDEQEDEDVGAITEEEIKREELSDEEEIQTQPTTTVVQRKHVLVSRDENIQKSRAELPIFAEEMQIVEAINENSVTVVCGETGSGKTTQIPQFLYEAGYANDGELIGITEPRRVAAISMAERVGFELGRPSEVAYQIRYEGSRSESTRILFMTDGVLLKEMEKDIMLKKYSVILIDEAHERSMYSDVLIGMLSRIVPLRAKTEKPLRLVIMSATLRLTDFTHQKLFPIIRPKIIKVDARQFPVTVHFEKKTPQNYLPLAFRKACRIHETLPNGAILIFVTGQNEVRDLMSKLKKRYPIVYEKDKSGETFVKGTRRWKEKEAQQLKNIKLEDFAEEEEPENKAYETHELDERGVGECFDDYQEEDEEELDEEKEAEETKLGPPPTDCAPLYCLPLFSLLSTKKQRRVFDPPPEGMRLCVVATNVAETSLTIPGVKYVMDGGFEKRRLFDATTGVSRFAVCRISQASADQRAGRAGRVAAGHAYRLFSSAVYQDFLKFSEPEILTKPSDQLVLHLKFMNIVKVVNFPFPSAPNEETLLAAERRLVKLGALAESSVNGKTEARITRLGKAMSVLPLAPAYAKFILMACEHDLMKHAVSLVSLLSIREPLLNVASLRGKTPEETKELMKNVLKQRKQWCSNNTSKRLGDVKVLMHAAHAAEQAKYLPEECEKLGIRSKVMMEGKKLRQQLVNILNVSYKMDKDLVIDVNLQPPNEEQSRLLRQIFVACFSDRIAKRVDRSAAQENIPKGAYQSTLIKEPVFLDPSSVLYTEEPEYVIYQEIVQISEKKLLQTICAVEPEWISRLAESSCRFGDMSDDIEPKYDESRDEIVRSVKVWFGPLDWPMPDVEKPIPHNIFLYRYFAVYFLDGTVRNLQEAGAVRGEISGSSFYNGPILGKTPKKRTENLLNRLVDKEVHSRKALKAQWELDENYLLEEYLEWLLRFMMEKLPALYVQPTFNELVEWKAAAETIRWAIEAKLELPAKKLVELLASDRKFSASFTSAVVNIPLPPDDFRYRSVFCSDKRTATVATALENALLAVFLQICCSQDESVFLKQRREALPIPLIFFLVSAMYKHQDLMVPVLKSLSKAKHFQKVELEEAWRDCGSALVKAETMLQASVAEFSSKNSTAGAQELLDIFLSAAATFQRLATIQEVFRDAGIDLAFDWILNSLSLVETIYDLLDNKTLVDLAFCFDSYPLGDLYRARSKTEQLIVQVFVDVLEKSPDSFCEEALRRCLKHPRILTLLIDLGAVDSLRQKPAGKRILSDEVISNAKLDAQEKALKELTASGLLKNLNNKSNDEISAKIDHVVGILPHLSSEYAHLALRHFGYDAERVIEAVLTREIPLQLQRVELCDLSSVPTDEKAELPFVDFSLDDEFAHVASKRKEPVEKTEPEPNKFKGLFSLAPVQSTSNSSLAGTSSNGTEDERKLKLIERLHQLAKATVSSVAGLNGERLVPMMTSKKYSALNSLKITKADEVAIRPTYDAYRYETRDEDDEKRGLYDDEYDDSYEVKEFTVEPLNEELTESSSEEDEEEGDEKTSDTRNGTAEAAQRGGRGRGAQQGGSGRGRGRGAPKGGRGGGGNTEATDSTTSDNSSNSSSSYTGGRQRQLKERHKADYKQRGADRKLRGAY